MSDNPLTSFDQPPPNRLLPPNMKLKDVGILIAIIATLTAIGLIPDPVPFIDEILMYAAGIGSYYYWYKNYHKPPQ